MDTVLIVFILGGLLVFNFPVEEKFAGRKFRGRKISRNSMRSGYLFRGRKISRKIQIREYIENFLHAKNTCYTVIEMLVRQLITINPNHVGVGFKYLATT